MTIQSRKTVPFVIALVMALGMPMQILAGQRTNVTVEVYTDVKPDITCNERLHVEDEKDRPIVSASLYLWSNPVHGFEFYAVSDSHGDLILKDMPRGTYQYRIDKYGYKSFTGEFTISGNERNHTDTVIMSKAVKKNDDDDEDEDTAVSSIISDGQWHRDLTGWWFGLKRGGYAESGWYCLNYNGRNNWYFFDKKGYVESGWKKYKGNWYFLHEIHDGTFGVMATGWNLIDGKWYFFEDRNNASYGILLSGPGNDILRIQNLDTQQINES